MVDLCCGRGGDIFKWEGAKVDKVLALDNHEESVKEAIERYKKVSRKIKPRINFVVHDVSCIKLSSFLNHKVSIISCQFALHYFDIATIIKEVSENLCVGFFMPSLLYLVLLGFNDKRHDNVTTNDKIFIYLTQVNFFKL